MVRCVFVDVEQPPREGGPGIILGFNLAGGCAVLQKQPAYQRCFPLIQASNAGFSESTAHGVDTTDVHWMDTLSTSWASSGRKRDQS